MSYGKAMKMSSQNTGACSVALCKEKAVVVVVDDYTYYWVYLSSEHPFQVCYKFATSVITKCDGLLLQSVRACLLQCATSVITKCHNFKFYCKLRQVLQGAKEYLPRAEPFFKQ